MLNKVTNRPKSLRSGIICSFGQQEITVILVLIPVWVLWLLTDGAYITKTAMDRIE